ncbi:cell division protein FtsL [Aliiglaciecola sp. 3_MG-2023]|uniref:cell division protein FtsL n=1 Tax=Aliiglaciecola sp. 3_MG-2023 TaxID=3062644 RepID=UPI0026E3CC16|nr:cell division protein FtsL [Aliiglaciecola sp. 3_MG-2023]MDO6692865.1 cell division protein FtsL [Aliiglaciecola sp. 3_MG-2023]
MTDTRTNFNLVNLIFTELARHPIRVLLFLMVLISAFAVIMSAHHNRQMSMALEQLMQEQDQLDIEWRHLILEQGALTDHNRIEVAMKKQLDMHRPSPEDEIVVRLK